MRYKVILDWIEAIAVIGILIAVGYPAGFYTLHGLDPTGWPDIEILKQADLNLNWITPKQWWQHLRSGDLHFVVNVYVKMLVGEIDTLAYGGRQWAIVMCLICFPWVLIFFKTEEKEPTRDPSNLYGRARWANAVELAALTRGIEIGRDDTTGQPVRIQVESNLVSIAPPRTGKTAGLVLPNLVEADLGSYRGPVIVIDPKGDAYRSTKKRREALGYRVLCFDPVGLINEEGDRWDPLAHHSGDDVLSMQSIAASLPPQSKQISDAGLYYAQLSTNHIAAAFTVAFRNGQPNAGYVAALCRNAERLKTELSGRTDALAESVLNVLNGNDDKVISNVTNTVGQAFAWSLDSKIQKSVSNPTFDIEDILNGKTDIFIIIPADDRKKIIAPLVRWMFAEMFATVRRNRLEKRILVIVDEANSLGAFDALVQALGELPGYGLSFWTIWQSWHQMVQTYGSEGAAIFLQTAEVTTISNLTATTPEDAERWSKAIGKFTLIEETQSTDNATNKSTTNRRSVGKDLVPASDLPDLTAEYLIAFATSKRATAYPMKLTRNYAPSDPRFCDLIDSITPVGPTESD